MKSFFSRLHDTQTGHSKSAATRESYKFWIPNADPDRESSKPTSGHENVVKTSSSRPQGEKRASSRAPKPPQSVPMPQYDRAFPSTSAAISGQTTEYIRQNMVSPSNPYYPQPPTKVTSTRARDYDDPRLQPPPRPPSRPSYPTRPTIIHDNPSKSSRHGNLRSESTAPIQHQVWIPTVAPSVSRQPEDQKKPIQEGDEAIERFRPRLDENDRPLESGRRDRDRLREKEKEKPRERDRERDRSRYPGRDREQERIRDDRERDRGRIRDKDRERERGHDAEREQERIKEREREREREREKERERERLERERERERERQERLERERERDREREKERERERAARHAERERREREREKERARIREREWEQKSREKENDANRESPTAKGKERAREERPVIHDYPSDPRIQDREIRKDREIRTARESENHRPRERDKDQPKYRAEATDGEQDLRRSKPRMTDKRKDSNQGWVSDNYGLHDRRPSRTANPETVLIEEAESSDGSLRPRQGIRMVPKRTRMEEGILSSKPPRSRQDRPPDFRSSLLPPNVPQSVIHPIVISDTQAPVTSTPLNMPVHLPPKDTKTADERLAQQSANAPLLTEVLDGPVRREINRLKLNDPPNESTTRVAEQSSSTNHRRPPSQISSNPHFTLPASTGYTYSTRIDPPVTSSRQQQSSVNMSQTNSNQQFDAVKEVLPRPEWTRGDHTLPNQLAMQEKSFIDSNAKQPALIPSEGYSRSRLNSLSTKPQNIPSSSQVNIIPPYPATVSQDSRPIGDLSTKQISMAPSDGYSRSRLNSLSTKPETFSVSHQNISIPVYMATVEQPMMPAIQSSVHDQKESQNKDAQLRAALESILSSENIDGSKQQPLHDTREVPVNHVTVPNEHPQIFQIQVESSRHTSKIQNAAPWLQTAPSQSIQTVETGMAYNGLTVQRPPSVSGYRDEIHQPLRNLHPLGSAERPVIVQASASSQSQKPADAVSSHHHRLLSDAQVNENRFLSSYEVQNVPDPQKPVPRLLSLDGPSRSQEPNDQEKVGLSLSRPPTSLGQNNGRILKHSGASIANPSAYPEIIRVLPSLQPVETPVIEYHHQTRPSVSGNGTIGVESSSLQKPLNVASDSTRTTSQNEYTRDTTIPTNKSSMPEQESGSKQESPKVLRHQRPSISHSEVYPTPFQEPIDSSPITHETSRPGPISSVYETRVDASHTQTNSRPLMHPTYSTRTAILEVQAEAQNPGNGTKFPDTQVDNHDGTRVVQNRSTPAMYSRQIQESYQSQTTAQPSTYGQSVLKEEDSPNRRPHRHISATALPSSRASKDNNNNGNAVTASQTTGTSTQPWVYAQKIDKPDLTSLQIDQPDSSTNDPTNFKRESPNVRSRHVTSTPKVETMGLQIPSTRNTKNESPRGIQITINTPGFVQQPLPPVNSEYQPQQHRHDSKQDSPRVRAENHGSIYPNNRLPVPVTQIEPLLREKSAGEQMNIQSQSKGNQHTASDPSIDYPPQLGAVAVPQMRIPEPTGDHLSKIPDGGMSGHTSQHGTTKAPVDLSVKSKEDGYLNGNNVPQLKIPIPVPSDVPKYDRGVHIVHSTPRVPPLNLNTGYPVQAPPLSARISTSAVKDHFPSLSEDTRPQTPRTTNNHEIFLARRVDPKVLNPQLGGTPDQPVQALDPVHVHPTHHRTASGSRQNPAEVAVDSEPVSLGFFSSAFSSALNASVGKKDAHSSKMTIANERMNSDSWTGKILHADAAENTAKISDSRLSSRDVQGPPRPEPEQKETTRFHRAPEIVKKDSEIEKASFSPRPPLAPFTHPGLAEILSSPPPRPSPMARYQNPASSEHVGGSTDHRMGSSFNVTSDMPKFSSPVERSQPIMDSAKPSIHRRHGSFQATTGDAPSTSKENLVPDNRKVSNTGLPNVATGGKEPSFPGPLAPTMLPSSNPAAGTVVNFAGSTREPPLHESRTHALRPPNLTQVNQGAKDYMYNASTFSSTRAHASTSAMSTAAHAPLQKQEPVSVADTNPPRGFVGRSGLESNPTGFEKRGYTVPPSAHTQQYNEVRGVVSENQPSQRAYHPATADSRPQAISQLPQSSFSSTYPSNRHQHSASLPVSFAPPPPPQSLAKNEDPAPVDPRTSTYRTTSHYQTTFTPFQAKTFPVNVSTADASIVSIPNAPSEETILKTPSSLAHSMMLKPTPSRQSEAPSVSSVKKGGLFKMFRRTSTPAPTPQYEVWHPNVNATTPDSSPGHGKSTRVAHETQAESSSPKKAAPAVEFSIPVPIHGQSERKGSHSHVFSPFKYLTSKRIRTVSIASVEAQDGTAANTVVGSPTASTHSQNLLLPPPVRDPLQATHEWRNKEEADAKVRAKAKLRRQPPGVVFDVGEEVPEDGQKRPRRMRTKYRSSTSTRQTAAEPVPQI